MERNVTKFANQLVETMEHGQERWLILALSLVETHQHFSGREVVEALMETTRIYGGLEDKALSLAGALGVSKDRCLGMMAYQAIQLVLRGVRSVHAPEELLGMKTLDWMGEKHDWVTRTQWGEDTPMSSAELLIYAWRNWQASSQTTKGDLSRELVGEILGKIRARGGEIRAHGDGDLLTLAAKHYWCAQYPNDGMLLGLLDAGVRWEKVRENPIAWHASREVILGHPAVRREALMEGVEGNPDNSGRKRKI